MISRLIWIVLFAIIPTLAAADEYAFVLKGRGNPFWGVIAQGIREAAAARGINAAIYNIDHDQDAEGQLNLCLTALERAPKFLVLGAITKSVGLECLKAAEAKGVPAADIDGNITVEDAKGANVQLRFSVGSDNFGIGRKAARYLKDISPVEDPKILIVSGLTGSSVSRARENGFESTIKELLPKATIVANRAADWDRLKAANITADFLQREDRLDFIYSVSDVMTYGIVESVKLSDRGENVKIISVDGNSDIRDSVKRGEVTATVAQLPYLMGKRSVEMAETVVRGGEVNSVEYIPTPILTAKMLEKSDDPTLQHLR